MYLTNVMTWDNKRAAQWQLFCREEATRTPDPHVPNVVRYQLRYFSLTLLFNQCLDIALGIIAAGCLDYTQPCRNRHCHHIIVQI